MIGSRLGNYVIKQQLGKGGMGEVYLAEHPQIGKRVALKVLHPELASQEDVVTRFFHEAKAVNDIGHPNIVDIQDYGSVPVASGNLVYLVMELLQGQTLTSVIRETPQMDERRAIRITRQIADALAASHARGIIHRDLKPDNVMLVTRGRDVDFVKLLDFGIAKVQGAMTMTRTGMAIGTPAYMSPEQCEGRPNIDHRTDVYALGIVLYEMLTGRIPFVGTSYGELLVKHIMETPPVPTSLRPGLSPHLELVILRALQKHPEDRFSSMAELADALGEPEEYVESHGGLGGFLPSPSRPRPPTGPQGHLARGTVVPPKVSGAATAPTMAAPASTTLSQSAAQVGATVQTAAPRKTSLMLGLGAIAVTGIGIFIALTLASKSGGDAKPIVAAAPSGPAAPQAPAPVAPPPAAVTPPPAAPPAATIKLTFETKPANASIFIAGEQQARCQTPCSFDVTRADGDATIAIKLAGYSDATRIVKLAADNVVDVTLAKKPSSRPHATGTGSHPIGDNTMNPFAQ